VANDIEFVDGLIVKAPHENAPSFLKASIAIKVEDLGKWLREKYKAGEKDWINIDVKESKGGKWYAAVSTYKPKEKDAPAPKKHPMDDLESDIPF
jgi:hypothetical protein